MRFEIVNAKKITIFFNEEKINKRQKVNGKQ